MRHPHGLRAAAGKGIRFLGWTAAQNGGPPPGTTLALTIDKPSAVQSGDLLIALCVAQGDDTWTGDTGWTEVIDSGSAPGTRIAYLTAGASEPASYTFTLSPGGLASGAIVAFRNAAYDTVGTISTTISSNIQTAPAITLSTSSSAILALFATQGTLQTWSNPTSGLVEIVALNSSGPSWALYQELGLPSGSTGTRSATCSSGSGLFSCLLVGIKPA